jgi:hypothetical protein
MGLKIHYRETVSYVTTRITPFRVTAGYVAYAVIPICSEQTNSETVSALGILVTDRSQTYIVCRECAMSVYMYVQENPSNGN